MINEQTIGVFLENLSSKAPVPGGGGASALAAALGNALGQMVANLTIGKKKYAQYEEEIKEIREKLETLQGELTGLADEDEKVFAPLAASYSLPSATEEEKAYKEKVMEENLLAASLVPLAVMEKAVEMMTFMETLGEKGSRLAVSDVGVGIQFIRTGLAGAVMNVYINTKSMKNREKAGELNEKANRLLKEGMERADRIYEGVLENLGAGDTIETMAMKGAGVSAAIKEQVEKELEALNGYIPKLAVIRVGENPDDMSYERGALKKMAAFGLKTESFVFPADISDSQFKTEFQKINESSEIDGILLLRPLPKQICEKDIEKMISPVKDLDGISPENIAKVFAGDDSGFAPCTAEAVIETLKAEGIAMSGKKAVVVGRSMVVGKPLSMLLLKENATVTVCHTRTADLEETCRQAEILVAAAGKAKMLGRNHVGKGAVVIDVGINVDNTGKLCGDVDFDEIQGIAAAATPVPGGVGAVTTAVLGKHLVKAAKLQGH